MDGGWRFIRGVEEDAMELAVVVFGVVGNGGGAFHGGSRRRGSMFSRCNAWTPSSFNGEGVNGD